MCISELVGSTASSSKRKSETATNIFQESKECRCNNRSFNFIHQKVFNFVCAARLAICRIALVS